MAAAAQDATASGRAAMTRSRDGQIRVLHVVATGAKRGGEIFASDLIRTLDEDGVLQHVAVLRDSGKLEVDFTVPVTRLLTQAPDARRFAFDVRIVRELRRALDVHHPDVLLAHGGEPLKYSIPAKARRPTRVVYRRIGSNPRPDVAPWAAPRSV